MTSNDDQSSLRSQFVTLNGNDKSLRSQIATLNDKGDTSRSQIVTLKKGRGQHKKYLPYAFTRNGIAMLSSVLHSDIAAGVNICITDLVRSARQRIILIDNFVDDKVYLLGASLKDIGTGLCAVTEMAIAPEMILELVKH